MMPANLDAASAAVLAWLLTYAIHSTILLAAAALVAWRFADHHAWLDVIWKTALVGPLVTATLSLGVDVVPLGGRWSMPSVVPVTGSPTPAPARTPADETRIETAITAGSVTSSPIDRAAKSANAASRDVGPAQWQTVVRAWPVIAVMSWLALAALGLARYGARLRRVYRGVGSGVPVTAPDLLDTVDAFGEAARSIRLTSSELIEVPLALAGRRIVLPKRFLDQLDADQQRAGLAHETAHVVRRDPEWRIVAGILEHALFFQPLNRLARVRLGDSAEFLSDQWAVQQTQSPIALARCLEVVASWSSAASDEFAVGVSAMARKDSPMIRRVTQILSEPAHPARRPRLLWLAIPLVLVSVAAPRVTASQLPSPVEMDPARAAILSALGTLSPMPADAAVPGPERRKFLLAEMAKLEAALEKAQADLRVYRPARPADSLEDRWRWALADAKRQRFADFWIVYSLDTDVHAQDLVITDTHGVSIVSNGDVVGASGPPLASLLPDGRGNLVVLLHYRGDAIDHGGYRSAKLGFEFGRTPVFWLGYADESQSFDRVQGLFAQARDQEIQLLLIELASMHANSNRVLPFLTQLVEPSRPTAIRQEAAEGFGHHHDPRSVEVLLRVARTDADSEVRAEAAETIGEVQTPQSIPALTDLVSESDDPAVRREAAEAFGEQPADQAIPAIERALGVNNHEDVLGELVEALGDIDDASVLALLVQTANTHPNHHVQQEAVETLGDIEEPGVADALVRIAREHPSEEVQSEAIETLADVMEDSLHPQILELAATGTRVRIRREAIEAIGDALDKISDPRGLDTAEQALQRAIFDDTDAGVRNEALDAADQLPEDRALRLLRMVIERHPDARMRREADDHLRDRRK